MQWRNSAERYGAVAQLLHWGMFGLIRLNFIGGEGMQELPKKTAIRGFAFDAQETVGLVVIFLLFLRLSWIVAAHAGAALWRHFVARDSVLRRMLPRRRDGVLEFRS